MTSDFDAFWAEVDAELARVPMAADVQPLPIRSSETFTAYSVRLTSIGPYRIFGYLSVPRHAGNVPANVTGNVPANVSSASLTGNVPANVSSGVTPPAPGLLLTPHYGSVNHVIVAGAFDTTTNCGGGVLASAGGQDVALCAYTIP